MEKTTHFGFREVASSEKAGLVADVFSSVASRYDVMNDAMSFGIHRFWKQFAAMHSGLKKGNHALDVAGGSGDMSLHFLKQVGADGMVTLTDINQEMLEEGRRRLTDRGYVGNIQFSTADAEDLPFDDGQFQCVCISFGLRNVTDKERALTEMQRVLSPGGRLLVLEFSKPVIPALEKVYDTYSFNVIPKMGRLIAGDEDSYRYLVESIRKHPDQQTMKTMMLDAGFDDVRVHNLTGGIVALHIGYRF
ncbi:MAG: bifunctional demethylmenaquinone methyltransferase/2-methoxy-6-polyprenyl-1,4-benzoquinol methylase UbiE [Pseudomonadota bacterium]